MKTSINNHREFFATLMLISIFMVTLSLNLKAQSDEEASITYIRPPFESSILIDNQTTVVPVKQTIQLNIQHRFGKWGNGYTDLYGLWAPSNIRLAVSYVPIDNLMIGAGLTKNKKLIDLNVKYLFLTQTRNGSMPLSIAYYGNMTISTMDASNFIDGFDRVSYYNQILISRKLSYRISIQIAPSYTHFNYVSAEFRNNDHVAIAGLGKLKVGGQTSIIVNIDQAITQHPLDNPSPNLALGVEMATSGHAFQLFIGNYGAIIPQENNFYNGNNYADNEFLIGFNITRLWNL